MTIVPSIGTVSITRRIASTAAWSDLWRSPCPIVWAQAIAAFSTTLRNSRERSASSIGFSVRRQFTTRRAIDAIPEHVVGLHQLVDLARTFVDHRAFAVAIEAAHRILVRVPIGAMNLHRVARRTFRGDGGEPLGQP